MSAAAARRPDALRVSVPSAILGAAKAAPATVSLGLAALATHMLGTAMPDLFDALVHADRAIMSGQAWRVATGHLVHLDATHLALNLAGLLALGAMIEARIGSGRLLGLLGIAGAAIAAGVLIDPAIAFYCGLSGVLNAVFACLAAGEALARRSVVWAMLTLGGLAKIAWEWTHLPIVAGALDWPPHTLSHLVGYVVGLGAALAWRRRGYFTPASMSEPT